MGFNSAFKGLIALSVPWYSMSQCKCMAFPELKGGFASRIRWWLQCLAQYFSSFVFVCSVKYASYSAKLKGHMVMLLWMGVFWDVMLWHWQSGSCSCSRLLCLCLHDQAVEAVFLNL